MSRSIEDCIQRCTQLNPDREERRIKRQANASTINAQNRASYHRRQQGQALIREVRNEIRSEQNSDDPCEERLRRLQEAMRELQAETRRLGETQEQQRESRAVVPARPDPRYRFDFTDDDEDEAMPQRAQSLVYPASMSSRRSSASTASTAATLAREQFAPERFRQNMRLPRNWLDPEGPSIDDEETDEDDDMAFLFGRRPPAMVEGMSRTGRTAQTGRLAPQRRAVAEASAPTAARQETGRLRPQSSAQARASAAAPAQNQFVEAIRGSPNADALQPRLNQHLPAFKRWIRDTTGQTVSDVTAKNIARGIFRGAPRPSQMNAETREVWGAYGDRLQQAFRTL